MGQREIFSRGWWRTDRDGARHMLSVVFGRRSTLGYVAVVSAITVSVGIVMAVPLWAISQPSHSMELVSAPPSSSSSSTDFILGSAFVLELGPLLRCYWRKGWPWRRGWAVGSLTIPVSPRPNALVSLRFSVSSP